VISVVIAVLWVEVSAIAVAIAIRRVIVLAIASDIQSC
jgi:hypothetical protein